MKPEFEAYRGERNDPKEPATVRLPIDMKNEAERFARAEGDSLSGLMIEGLARVIEDRKNDPNWVGRMRATVAEQVTELEAQLAAAKAQLESLPSVE